MSPGPCVPHLEPGGPASAPQTQAPPDLVQPATPAGADDDQRHLVVRFRVRYLRSDNGPEFVSTALLRAPDEGIDMAIIEPGKPWQNGCTERFNGKFRDECLRLEGLRNRAEAKVMIEIRRKHYNEVRPHSNLGCLTPNELKAGQSTTTPPRTVFQ